jgi:cytochrome c oxidase assembly factor CtaG
VGANYSWSLEPGVLLSVAVVLWLYVARWRRVRREDGPRAASGWRLTSFVAGNLVVLAALVSPVDSLAEQLLAMHMVQHLLLIDAAPILLILGLTKVILRPATRRLQSVERAAGPLGHPAFAVAAYVAGMWIWHIPFMYDAAARHDVIHVLEHVTFISVGLLYWWHLISPIRSRMRLGGMGPIAYMLVTKLLVGILGIGLAFAPGSFYDFYGHQPDYWGMTPSTDQAVAGLLMALEQSIVMGIALTWLFARMLAESEREEQRAERFA